MTRRLERIRAAGLEASFSRIVSVTDVMLLKGRCHAGTRLTDREGPVRQHHGARETDTWMDDQELQRLIVDRLDNDPAFWIGRRNPKTMIVVEVDDGYVTLSGIVKSPVERRRADIVARALGAIGVDNRLRLEGEIREPPS